MQLLIANIVLILVEALLLKLFVKNETIRNWVFLAIAFVQLFVLHAFVDIYSVHDLGEYFRAYNLVGTHALYHSIYEGYSAIKMEPGWLVLNKVLYLISPYFRLLLIATSLMMIGFILRSVRHYSTIMWLSVYIFLCSMYGQSIFVLRQYCAMSICLFSIKYIIDRKPLGFAVAMLVAANIHITALVFVPLYVVYSFKPNTRIMLFAILAAVVVKLSTNVIFNYLFTSSSWYSSYATREGANYTSFFIMALIFVLYLYSFDWKLDRIDGIDRLLFYMSLIAMIILFAGVGFSPTNRLAKYYSIAEILIIPRALSGIESRLYRYGILAVLMLAYLLLFLSPTQSVYLSNYRLIF